METEATPDGTPEPLPHCLIAALSAADDLYMTLSETPFPDLEPNVATVEDAAAIVHAALLWAKTVDAEHRKVVGLFPPRETGVQVDVPRPQMTGRLMMHMGPSGRPEPIVGFAPQPPAQGQVTQRPLRMSIASDVLEPIPARYEDSLAGVFPYLPVGGLLPTMVFLHHWVSTDWNAGGWALVRKQLAQARLVVRAKCLGLVGWVRRRVAEIKTATYPAIKWKSSRKNNGHTVEVSMTGAARDVDLSNGEHRFLMRLAKGPAEVTRPLKGALMKKLPELAPYIESRGTGSKDTIYVLPPEVRETIRVAPRR
jgi:hypothetical protein